MEEYKKTGVETPSAMRGCRAMHSPSRSSREHYNTIVCAMTVVFTVVARWRVRRDLSLQTIGGYITVFSLPTPVNPFRHISSETRSICSFLPLRQHSLCACALLSTYT